MKKKITILLLSFCVIFAAACSPSTPTDILKADMEKAKASPDNVIKGLNSEEAFGKEATEALVEKILDFDYEFGEEKTNGDTASVKTTITTYPIGEIFVSVFEELAAEDITALSAMTYEERVSFMSEILTEKLDKAEKSYKSEIDIILEKKDGKWEAQSSQELSNALTGGMADYISKLFNQ